MQPRKSRKITSEKKLAKKTSFSWVPDLEKIFFKSHNMQNFALQITSPNGKRIALTKPDGTRTIFIIRKEIIPYSGHRHLVIRALANGRTRTAAKEEIEILKEFENILKKFGWIFPEA